MNKASIRSYTAVGISALVYLVLGYFTPKHDFVQMLLLYAVSFAAYIYLVKQKTSIWIGIGAAIGFRILLLFAVPSPTIGSSVFWWHLPHASIGTLLLRALWILCEAGTIVLLLRLLRKMGLPDKNVLLYALNPLVVLELALHLHPYAWLIMFLVLVLYFLCYQRHLLAGASFGLAVGVVSVPLLFLPLVFRRIEPKNFFFFLSTMVLVLLLLFYTDHTEANVQHYLLRGGKGFQDYTFNASLYHLFKWISYVLSGATYADLGLVMVGLIATFAVAIAIIRNPNSVRRLAGYMATVYSFYLFLNTTVYPWQLVPLLALTCLSHFRFAVFWSALIIMTYNPVFRKYEIGLSLLEYSLVFLWLIVELYLYRQRRIQNNLRKTQL